MFNLKEIRKNAGVTQRQLANAANLDIRWIQKLEASDVDIENITIKNFRKLVRGISVLLNDNNCDSTYYDIIDKTLNSIMKEDII